MAALDDMLSSHGIGVAHNFGGGTYAKEMRIPAGSFIKQHTHEYDHLSILASGKVVVEFSDRTERLSAPVCVTIPSGHAHRITAVTDAVWYCIHATQVTDAEEIDSSIMQEVEHASR